MLQFVLKEFSLPQHISRKELKKDEIRETLSHGAEAIASHQRALWIYGGVAAFVVLAVLGWRYYSRTQTAKASVALADAMKVYQARIRTASEPAQPDEITYVDEKNKYSDAVKDFINVANRYSRTRPGQLARYYAALSLEKLGRYDEAENDLKSLESSRDESLSALARFKLAQVYDEAGKGPQAVQLYQDLTKKPSLFVPKPVVLLALADHYSGSDPTQAAKLYNQIKTEFPDTQAAQEADQRLQLLQVKG
jgi:predicted negative regulator of RcsB-dependent stress response